MYKTSLGCFNEEVFEKALKNAVSCSYLVEASQHLQHRLAYSPVDHQFQLQRASNQLLLHRLDTILQVSLLHVPLLPSLFEDQFRIHQQDHCLHRPEHLRKTTCCEQTST